MPTSGRRKRVIIMGAAGRDFHNFNVLFRNNPEYEVVAFTAAQIPNIANRVYPPELAGPLYPQGIPIYPEDMLPELIRKYSVDLVVLSYSDLLYEDVMRKASIVLAAGASFMLVNPFDTMLKSSKPVIAVTAIRTGAGKSTVSRKIVSILEKLGLRPVVIRHPMPYGDLRQQICQRFASYEDLDRCRCTLEEREEYEPYIEMGVVVYAGVDYEKILREAEKEADVIVWDGGNNDTPFIKPDLWICVADPTRPGHEVKSYPGEVNLRLAHVVVINKCNIARPEDIETVERNVRSVNPDAVIVRAESRISVDKPELIRGRRVLVVEDAPSVTHGHMSYGAGYVAAITYGASEIIDPRHYAVGSIKKAYEEYPHIGPVLPTMGYSEEQLRDLEETIRRVPADVVVLGTPCDLSRVIRIDKPVVRVRYELVEITRPTLEDIIREFLVKHGLAR